MRTTSRFLKLVGIAILVFLFLFPISYLLLSHSPTPERITYGASFNTMYARELGLDWLDVYTAMLEDLQIKHLRLAAHWPMVEPVRGVWNFSELDTQIGLAEKNNAEVVLAVGRRLPRWPECHVPEWAKGDDWEKQKAEIRTYLERVVVRYRDSPAVKYWQVENEPYLSVFAPQFCGSFDEAFLDEEIALVRKLDPTRPILVTDSGNLGLWKGAYSRGDAFGTSMYVYLWNDKVGPIKSRLPPSFYRAKAGLMGLVYGKKEVMLIELSAEPWLLTPVTEAPLDTQLARMDIEKFNEILLGAKDTRFEKQFLWGAEWWYYLQEQGHPEFWERAREVYRGDMM